MLKRNFIFWLVILAGVAWGASQFVILSTHSNTSPLIISELSASNGFNLADEDGDFPDWIELYNRSGQPVNLAGWALTDDPARPEKWLFPDATLGSHDYLIVFASGKNRRSSQLHTNFKLNKNGEFLGLYNIYQNSFADSLSPRFPPQIRDSSYGRLDENSRIGYLTATSPGLPNTESQLLDGIAATVQFSHSRGFYNKSFAVDLKTDTSNADIRYTVDGSEPSESHGETFSGPIPISKTTLLRAVALKPGLYPSKINTHSYIFLDQIIAQPANPPGLPPVWGTYQEYYPGLPEKGAPVPADYQMDPGIVQNPQYRDSIKDDLKSIPSVSIVTAPENFDIYINARETGVAWERPASIEWIEPPDSDQPGFQINAGLRMQGRHGRWEFMPKHSFRFLFKGIYGATKLDYPVFPKSPVQQFDTLILRAGSNRSYAGYIRPYDYRLVTYARDEWVRASQIAVSGVGAHGTFVHVYLNGLYWGLYNILERPDASFASAYFGGNEEDWSIIKHGFIFDGPDKLIEHGELAEGPGRERYETLHQMVQQGEFDNPEIYAQVSQLLDIPHFIDYLLVNWYAGNDDWIENNWYVVYHNPSGKLKYFTWDAERSWRDGAELYLDEETLVNRIKPLVEALMENPDFRIEFADHLYKNLFNNGPLSDAQAQARWMEITNYIERAIVGESARWGDTRYTDAPVEQEDWLNARQTVFEQMENNSAKLVSLLREADFYPAIDPPEFNRQGGQVESGFTLKVTVPQFTKEQGVIYFTTNGSDPRLPVSGLVNPAATPYSEPIFISSATPVKARVYSGTTWSALNEAEFQITSGQSRMSITEIMYNPLDGDDYEFLELKNSGTVNFNPANLSFEGIDFTVPPNSPVLLPGQFAVLARNAEAFATKYPNVPIFGIYQGQLSNKGETILLKNSTGETLLSVTYNDENGWPVSPDGRGDSLTLINIEGDPNEAKNWQAGDSRGGSPGR